MKNYYFPIIRKLVINDFTLYKKVNQVSIDLPNGVFCLVGANGLGKSTFINILNFALTGIVKRPDSDFSQFGSIPQFYTKSKSFAPIYFDRRIDENYRSVANVTVEFSVRNTIYTVTRNFFSIDAIESLSIIRENQNLVEANTVTEGDLDSFYKKTLAENIGLGDFEQFVFLQFFVFTFDETHQLLFWDNSLMERVLYLFFNLDPSKAKIADQLRKEITATESSMRNLQWDATQKGKELASLLSQIEDSGNSNAGIQEEDVKQYQELSGRLNDTLDMIQNVESELKECDLLLADYRLRMSTLKSEYDLLFNSSFNRDAALEKDPAIIDLLFKIRHNVCDGVDPTPLFSEIIKIIWETKCIKNSNLDSEEQLARLRSIDEDIFSKTSEHDKIQKRKDRLTEDYKQYRNKANEIKSLMDEIEQANENFVLSLYKNTATTDLSVLVTSMRSHIDRILQIKQEESKKRDLKREELKILERELNQKYVEAEEKFMPIFVDYARNFLGLDVNVNIQTYAKGATLILEVNDSLRKEKYQLSESQRYFIDIALRMALIEYSSEKAVILIDTPEGSLDIAYESKAGKMFADFTKKDYNLLMTANINSSMLLIQLATQCGSGHMKLEKMTDWTFLSEVQQQEQAYMQEAFQRIEEILEG
ncbi:AAA family ATPase [Chitinophaga rhizosphaerae]|uniref:AAA family ATPase n=1 Tax=Chitinophaga rhizosphaerae TaxID=1864947 RepID=UPI000F810CE1|nr:AAA family ATPase [Chitinophaga rhizosphaerae]